MLFSRLGLENTEWQLHPLRAKYKVSCGSQKGFAEAAEGFSILSSLPWNLCIREIFMIDRLMLRFHYQARIALFAKVTEVTRLAPNTQIPR